MVLNQKLRFPLELLISLNHCLAIYSCDPRKHPINVAIAGNLYSDISDHLPVFLGIADVKRSNTARPSIRIYSEKILITSNQTSARLIGRY